MGKYLHIYRGGFCEGKDPPHQSLFLYTFICTPIYSNIGLRTCTIVQCTCTRNFTYSQTFHIFLTVWDKCVKKSLLNKCNVLEGKTEDLDITVLRIA